MLAPQISLSRRVAPAATPPVQSSLSGQVFGMLINLSGRRRFTSQRLILYAVLAAQGKPGALEVSQQALELFREAHATLVNGNSELPGIFCDELEHVYFGAPQGDRRIGEFILLAERALNAVRRDAGDAASLLDALVAEATPLLALLNQITQVYEGLSRRHARQVKQQLHDVMTHIESIARQARMVSFNAQIIAARAGHAGREFGVVASVLTDITSEIDKLVREAICNSVA